MVFVIGGGKKVFVAATATWIVGVIIDQCKMI